MYLSRILLKAKEFIIGSDYGYACPDAIQINMNKGKWSVCQANGMLLVA